MSPREVATKFTTQRPRELTENIRVYKFSVFFGFIFCAHGLGGERIVMLSPAQLGSARLGPARPGPARPGPARLGSARLGSAQLGSECFSEDFPPPKPLDQ